MDADPAADHARRQRASLFSRSASESNWTHVRLNIYPDGGVARFRVYGEPWLDHAAIGTQTIDLASALNGGRVIAFSDAHYGAFHRMLSPGRGLDMGDGWETRRRRVPGNDWIIVALGARGVIEGVELDTAHYKGNYPDAASIQAADLGRAFDTLDDAVIAASMFWAELLPPQKLKADAIHKFEKVTQRRPGDPRPGQHLPRRRHLAASAARSEKLRRSDHRRDSHA